MTKNDIITLFKESGLRITPQRIAVYEYLCQNPVHPDAEEIYKSVIRDNPSFSKTTVYNSLQSLEKKGMIIAVRIDSERIHYDANLKMHGHFLCCKCKKIFDFGIESINDSCIDGFDIKQKDVYYSGLCPVCKNN